jgi:hypothetical protein
VGGGFGAFVVGPGLANRSAVEGLPSGERGCLREDSGQCGPLRSSAVGEELLYVVDLGAEWVELGEAPKRRSRWRAWST